MLMMTFLSLSLTHTHTLTDTVYLSPTLRITDTLTPSSHQHPPSLSTDRLSFIWSPPSVTEMSSMPSISTLGFVRATREPQLQPKSNQNNGLSKISDQYPRHEATRGTNRNPKHKDFVPPKANLTGHLLSWFSVKVHWRSSFASRPSWSDKLRPIFWQFEHILINWSQLLWNNYEDWSEKWWPFSPMTQFMAF